MAIDPGPLHTYHADDSLLGRVSQLLASMDRRKRIVLERRMGLVEAPASLADIAQSFQLTRERIRQVELAAVQELSPMDAWFRTLAQDLAHLLRLRELPLAFLGAVELEPRLQGMTTRHSALMSYLLQRLGAGGIYVVENRDIVYLMLLSQRDWEGFRDRMLKAFRTDEWAGTPLRECQRHVRQQGQGLDKGTLELCWQEIVLTCGFIAVPHGIVLKPATYVGWVRCVLAAADEPMYLEDITQRVQSWSGQEFPARSMHNAIINTGVLFNRGLYGLERHIRIAPDMLPRIVQAAEQRIAAGPPSRQWHASELLIAVLQALGPVPGLTKYTLNYVLRSSRNLQNLKRMVWRRKTAEGADRMTRINIRDAVIAILEEAGCPLSVHEIHKRLTLLRGLDQDLDFHIHAGDRLVHLASGLWGIKGRDDVPELFAGIAEP